MLHADQLRHISLLVIPLGFDANLGFEEQRDLDPYLQLLIQPSTTN